MKMFTFCKSSRTEYLMINRARVGNFATLRNSKISKYITHLITPNRDHFSLLKIIIFHQVAPIKNSKFI